MNPISSSISPSSYPPIAEPQINPTKPQDSPPSVETPENINPANEVNEGLSKDAFEAAYKTTAAKVSHTVTSYIQQQLDKPTIGVDGNISWPIKSLWGKVTTFWKEKTPSPLLEVRTEIQKSIEDAAGGNNWFKKTLKSLADMAETVKTTEDKETLLELYKKHKQIELLANCPLPNDEIPLHYAARMNNHEGMQTLLRLNATPFQKNAGGNNILRRDVHGQTIFDYATLNDHPQVKGVIIDFFNKLSNKLLDATLQGAISEKIPVNAQFFEFAEQNVYRRINELLEDTAKKQMVADTLSPTTQQWIQAGLVASLATSWTLSKLLNSYEGTANGTLANHAENTTQLIATLGSYLQMIELSSNFMTFVNGIVQSKTPIVPLLSHIGMQVLGSIYKPFEQLNTVINTVIVASTIIDTSYVCYQNRKQRPFAAATKALVTGINLAARYTNVFEIFKPKVPEGFKASDDLAKTQVDIIKSMYIKELGISPTIEDVNLVEQLTTDPKSCTKAYHKLGQIWHPDKHPGKGNLFDETSKLRSAAYDLYCNKRIPTENTPDPSYLSTLIENVREHSFLSGMFE